MRKTQIKRIIAPIFIITAILTQQITVLAFSQDTFRANAAPNHQQRLQAATPTPLPSDQVRGRPPLSLTLSLLGMCCVFGVLIGVVILGFVVRAENKRDLGNQQRKRGDRKPG